MSRRYRGMMLSCWGSRSMRENNSEKCAQEPSILGKGKSSKTKF
jgi:hypothetical protein